MGWVIVGASVVVGLAVGFLFIKYKKLGAFCLASWGGFSLGLLMYNAFIYKIDSEIALWGFAVGIGLTYGVLVFYFFDHVLIHATAFIGSFLAIFGVGLIAGKYPNPFTIA